ncbi:TetR/AcrR family transcriptional regulator [Eubacteriales bacterium OttesenSCG-928-N13]|nr:TetR/AcrR family transcriptional regulator [Eubacteriales bacterium OttesenSCG-928-N13]
MAGIIRPLNEELRDKILQAGKDEFFRLGYQKATIRDIAALAGVTTGAIYCYFPNKKALFDALVEAPTQTLLRTAQAQVAQMNASMSESTANHLDWMTADPSGMIDYVYEHFDAFRLLRSCGTGSGHEGFVDALIELETDATMMYIAHLHRAGIIDKQLDRELVHIAASTYFSGIFELIDHDTPKEKAIGYIQTLADFYAAGWKKILGI